MGSEMCIRDSIYAMQDQQVSVGSLFMAGVLPGILITAALFLRLLQQVFFGDLPKAREGFPDVSLREGTVLAALLALVILIGVYPRWLLDLIGSASSAMIGG